MQRKLAKSRSNPTELAPCTLLALHSAQHFQFPFALICLGFFFFFLFPFVESLCGFVVSILARFSQVLLTALQMKPLTAATAVAPQSRHRCRYTDGETRTDRCIYDRVGLKGPDSAISASSSSSTWLRLRHVCHINFNRSARKCVSL